MDMLAVLTSPRPYGVSYVEATLHRLEENGGAGGWKGLKVVYSDGRFEDDRAWLAEHGWALIERENAGECIAMLNVFRLAIDHGAERLTFLEDDVSVCRNALLFIQEFHLSEHVAMLKWYDCLTKPEPRGVQEMVINRTDREVLGAVAFTMPRRTIELVLRHEMAEKWPLRHFGDGLVRHVLVDQAIGSYCPNLVQHVGGISSTGNRGLNDRRKSHTYPGDEFDALTLTR